MTSRHVITPEARAKAAELRKRNTVERKAAATHLRGGAKVYKDAPPGTDYVLEFPNRRKCYYPSVEFATRIWNTQWAPDWGLRDAQGNLTEPLVA